MVKHFTYLSLAAAVLMTGCSTSQVPTTYQNTSNHTGTLAAAKYASNTPVQYAQNTSAGRMVDQECLRRETNRELIGGAIGGTAGAIAGKKLLGGTKGLVAGAALGGAAGFGIGDKTINCDPIPATTSNAAYQSVPTTYQNDPTYDATPTSCPSGTISQPNGTCLIRESSASYQTSSLNTVQTSAYQQRGTLPRASNVVKAYAMTTSSPQTMPQITRNYGASTYQVESGDTVYSLARRRCVSVEDIQGSNGLDRNYGIQIGQTLQLPANQC